MTKDYSDQISRAFTAHIVNEEQDHAMHRIREGAFFLAQIIDQFCPNGREKSVSLTHLEEVMFWANAGIARVDFPKSE